MKRRAEYQFQGRDQLANFCRSSHAGDIGHTAGVYQVFYVRTSDGWRIEKRIERIVEHTVAGVTTWYSYPEGNSAL